MKEYNRANINKIAYSKILPYDCIEVSFTELKDITEIDSA